MRRTGRAARGHKPAPPVGHVRRAAELDTDLIMRFCHSLRVAFHLVEEHGAAASEVELADPCMLPVAPARLTPSERAFHSSSSVSLHGHFWF
jgi:hypothetical protein